MEVAPCLEETLQLEFPREIEAIYLTECDLSEETAGSTDERQRRARITHPLLRSEQYDASFNDNEEYHSKEEDGDETWMRSRELSGG